MVETTRGWFEEAGDDSDVVISTRIRFGRNIAHTGFLGSVTDDDSENLVSILGKAFDNALPETDYITGTVSGFSPLERRLLTEKRLLPSQYILNQDYPLFIDRKNTVSGYINDTDHLRFAVIHGGRNVFGTYKDCARLDDLLENHLDYAASIDWGYLSPDLASSGLGVRGSFLLHLPGLVRTEMIENALKAVLQYGFTVKGFQSDTGKSMADLYQVSNGVAFGTSDEEFCQKLDVLGRQLVLYERRSREELQRKQSLDIEDSIMRSYGILKYCRTLDYLEALEHLSHIRLGACIGLLPLEVDKITALFFLVEKSHIQGSGETDSEHDISVYRAGLIQRYLEKFLKEEQDV